MSELVDDLNELAFGFGTLVDQKGCCTVLINLYFLTIRGTGCMNLLFKIGIIKINMFQKSIQVVKWHLLNQVDGEISYPEGKNPNNQS